RLQLDRRKSGQQAHRVGYANARWLDLLDLRRDLLERLELLRECDPVLQRERTVLHQPHDLAFDLKRASPLRRGEHADPVAALEDADLLGERVDGRWLDLRRDLLERLE